MDPQTVLDRHRDQMIRTLRNVKAASQGSPKLRRFCDRVHADLEQVTDTPARRDYLPGEDVFIWSADELLRLAEAVRPAPPDDPYLVTMLARLRDLGGRLERGDSLPPDCNLHWFDEDDDDFVDEWYEMLAETSGEEGDPDAPDDPPAAGEGSRTASG